MDEEAVEAHLAIRRDKRVEGISEHDHTAAYRNDSGRENGITLGVESAGFEVEY
jgi:hypothetical protein